jgi:hypothetical protein
MILYNAIPKQSPIDSIEIPTGELTYTNSDWGSGNLVKPTEDDNSWYINPHSTIVDWCKNYCNSNKNANAFRITSGGEVCMLYNINSMNDFKIPYSSSDSQTKLISNVTYLKLPSSFKMGYSGLVGFKDADNSGGTLKDTPSGVKFIDCMNSCVNNRDCTGVLYETKGGRCKLFNKVPTGYTWHGYDDDYKGSGVYIPNMQSNCGYYLNKNSRFSDSGMNVSDIRACRSLCDADPQCYKFGFDRTFKRCYLPNKNWTENTAGNYYADIYQKYMCDYPYGWTTYTGRNISSDDKCNRIRTVGNDYSPISDGLFAYCQNNKNCKTIDVAGFTKNNWTYDSYSKSYNDLNNADCTDSNANHNAYEFDPNYQGLISY